MIKRSVQTLLMRVRQPETIPPPWNWPFGAGMAVMYLVVLLAALLFTTSLSDSPIDEFPEPDIFARANLIGCILAGILIYQYVTMALYRAKETKSTHREWSLIEILHLNPSINTPQTFVALTAFTVVIVMDVLGFIAGVPSDSLPRPLLGLEETSGDFLIGVLAMIVTRPIVEEIIFQGILYPSLRKQMPPFLSILITTLVFAGLHLLLDSDIWWGGVYPLVLGLTAGLARAATQSTRSAIMTHVMFGVFMMLRAVIL
ncbi:MAG: CPBP family intramembrane metalloprotease [Anaerolineae bacterium]|nr:CPBP family intramembrane metalloprotease [Anaerolineae bacterium]